MTNPKHKNLASDFVLAGRVVEILQKSEKKAQNLLDPKKVLNDDERETLEALTSRFGRALDFLIQKLLRSIDQIELTDEGSVLDRVNRFKKREVLQEEIDYGVLKLLRNQIVHEYIIDESDRVVVQVLKYTPLVVDMLEKARAYCEKKGFL